MPHVLRRGLALSAVSLVLLTGCATAVTGTASPGPNEPTDVSQDELAIDGSAAGNEVDDTARDALADLNDYWTQTFPEVFGSDYEPLQGTLNSVDPDDFDEAGYPEGLTCGLSVDEVEQNAYYCGEPGYPNADGITYDRAFMAELADEYGRYLPSLVMAHEWGHSIQARDQDSPQVSINAETQADCYAGSFSRWVVDGNAAHTSLRLPELDRALLGFQLIRDPVGTDPNEEGAHGSFFDRVSGFQEGYDGGAQACASDFGDDERVFTQQPFTDDADLANSGNLPYDQAIDFTQETLSTFWSTAFDQLFSSSFTEPTLTAFDGTAPDCGDMGSQDRDLGYCQSDETVYFDETDLTQPAYDIGDYAVATAISLPYALAARQELGLSDNDAAATQSAVCASGWYSAALFRGLLGDNTLSPGDLDEAISFLLTYGQQPSVFPDNTQSGFELVDTFRNGFLTGAGACDLGV